MELKMVRERFCESTQVTEAAILFLCIETIPDNLGTLSRHYAVWRDMKNTDHMDSHPPPLPLFFSHAAYKPGIFLMCVDNSDFGIC